METRPIKLVEPSKTTMTNDQKKKAHKKKKRVSKHVLKAQEKKVAITSNVDAQSDVTASKKKKKPKHKVKDPSEAHKYLAEWKALQDGKDTSSPSNWKFNKNTQSWLIRHMYNADKVPKGAFLVLSDYLKGLNGNEGKIRMVEDAKRRALRYKEYEKSKGNDTSDESPGEQENDAAVDKVDNNNNHDDPDKDKDDEDVDDGTHWNLLNDHDKRKEYKRARKILELFQDLLSEV